MKNMVEKSRMTPKEIIKEFKIIMSEASKFYSKPASKVNEHEFYFVSRGRVGRNLVNKVGRFGRLKTYLYPDKTNIDSSAKALIERILAG